MALHSPVPESPSHDKPHLTPDIHFWLGMDLEHGRFLKLEHSLPCWRFRPRWPGKHVHTETAGTFCSAPRQKNKPRRRSCEVWVPFIDSSLHTLAFSPRPLLQSAGIGPRSAERTSLAGTPSPQDAILHDGIPPGTGDRGGGGEEVSHGLTSQSRPPLPRAKSLSAQEPREQHIQPTHLHRADPPSMPGAHTGPRENQPYGKRQTASSDPPSTSSAGSAQEPAGKRGPACSVQPCGVFKSR